MLTERQVHLPNIGDFKQVDVIEVLVKPGDKIKADDPLITLESDKATMEVPSPYSGTVKEPKVRIGDKVSEGSLILIMEEEPPRAETGVPEPQPSEARKEFATLELPSEETTKPREPQPETAPRPPPVLALTAETVRGSRSATAHASPSIRRFARELGVDLGLVTGSGPKGRILKGDVKNFTREAFAGARMGGATGTFFLSQVPPIDFSKFGKTELRPLSRIKRIAGQNLHRSWMTVPHVTQFDEADITDLEEFRKSKLKDAAEKNRKLTVLPFLLKASVVALKKYPEFNASLTTEGDSLVLKRYFHIGVAVNTDEGLVVPVIRDVDQKGLFQLAAELQTVSAKAREGKLDPREMQGGCFTISNLGGIGGAAFTPIINFPEVAILGVSRAVMKPVYENSTFVPRLMLPLALSYDHRVIDGVAGAQFLRFLSEVLSDIRQILL